MKKKKEKKERKVILVISLDLTEELNKIWTEGHNWQKMKTTRIENVKTIVKGQDRHK